MIRRAAKSFQFVTQGTYVKQGEQVRAREAKKMLAGFTSGRNPRGYQKESIVPVDEDAAEAAAGDATGGSVSEPATVTVEHIEVDVPLKPVVRVPDVEWWDIEYLPKDQRTAVDKFGFVKPASRKEQPDLVIAYASMKLKWCATVHVIEHPARVNPLVKKDDAPIVLPLMLTAAVRLTVSRLVWR